MARACLRGVSRARVCQGLELFGRQFVLDGLGYVVDGGVLALSCSSSLSLATRCRPDFSGDLAVHAEQGGDLFFLSRRRIWSDEVIAFVGASAHAGLTHQDDARQQDCFEGDDRAEKRKGWGIEVTREGERSRVEYHPSREDRQMDADERKAPSCEMAGDGRRGVRSAAVRFVRKSCSCFAIRSTCSWM